MYRSETDSRSLNNFALGHPTSRCSDRVEKKGLSASGAILSSHPSLTNCGRFAHHARGRVPAPGDTKRVRKGPHYHKAVKETEEDTPPHQNSGLGGIVKNLDAVQRPLTEGKNSDPEIRKAKWQEPTSVTTGGLRPHRVCPHRGNGSWRPVRGGRRRASGDPCHVEAARNGPGGGRQPSTVAAAAEKSRRERAGSRVASPGPAAGQSRPPKPERVGAPGKRALGHPPRQARLQMPGIWAGLSRSAPNPTPGCRARGARPHEGPRRRTGNGIKEKHRLETKASAV